MYYYLVATCTAKGFPGKQRTQEVISYLHSGMTQRGLTGIFLYCNDNLIIYLEGPQEKVTKSYNWIVANNHLVSTEKLLEDHIDDRSFPSWSLGFRTNDPDYWEMIKGFRNVNSQEFLYKELDAKQNAGVDLVKYLYEYNINLMAGMQLAS